MDAKEAMQKLAALNNRSQETSPEVQKLIFTDIPNAIESLELQKRFDEAQQLAQAKYDTAAGVFGKQSVAALDALQDLIFLQVQKHDEQQKKRYLSEYASLANTMRSSGRGDLVDKANDVRAARLQRKLEEASAALKFE